MDVVVMTGLTLPEVSDEQLAGIREAAGDGATVTVVDGLPRNAAFLKNLGQELKRACGTGGAASDGAIELQGDLRDRIRDVLSKKGFVVKG